jgi:hypothetical protein
MGDQAHNEHPKPKVVQLVLDWPRVVDPILSLKRGLNRILCRFVHHGLQVLERQLRDKHRRPYNDHLRHDYFGVREDRARLSLATSSLLPGTGVNIDHSRAHRQIFSEAIPVARLHRFVRPTRCHGRAIVEDLRRTVSATTSDFLLSSLLFLPSFILSLSF